MSTTKIPAELTKTDRQKLKQLATWPNAIARSSYATQKDSWVITAGSQRAGATDITIRRLEKHGLVEHVTNQEQHPRWFYRATDAGRAVAAQL